MRKIYLALVSCVALVAFMGFGGSAFAVVDPSCDGDPYNNDFAVHDFTLDTPDSHVAGDVSGVSGSGLACGTEISGTWLAPVGAGTLNDNADILAAPGVKVNPTAGMPVDSYAGAAVINSASWAPIFGALIIPDVHSDLTVAPIGTADQVETCAYEAAQAVGGPEPGEIVACYRGTTDPTALVKGHNFSWQTLAPDGRYTLTIGRFYNDLLAHPAGIEGVKAGLTHIKEFTLCNNIGAPITPGIGGQCGTSSDPWIQKNGIMSTPINKSPLQYCPRDAGLYTVTVTNKAGETTGPVSSRVIWTRGSTGSSITWCTPYLYTAWSDKPAIPK